MKCPNCGNEMVSGIIESGREIMWRKEGEKQSKRISSRLFISSKACAERCEECKSENFWTLFKSTWKH